MKQMIVDIDEFVDKIISKHRSKIGYETKVSRCPKSRNRKGLSFHYIPLFPFIAEWLLPFACICTTIFFYVWAIFTSNTVPKLCFLVFCDSLNMQANSTESYSCDKTLAWIAIAIFRIVIGLCLWIIPW